MNSSSQSQLSSGCSRRAFLESSGRALVGSTVLAAQLGVNVTRAAQAPLLRVGLIGCGGRGTGAAAQALAADPNVKLVALADAFEDYLEKSLATLKQQQIAGKIDVPAARRFVGFDAYRRLIDCGVDVVLLATPPQFRPLHMKAAVEAGKHVFAEKPIAVDSPGVRSVLASCAEAQKKGLAVVSGLALRYNYGFRDVVGRIHDGALGGVRVLQANDFRGPIWVKPRQPQWTEMEYQMRNWYYFTWLSGDFNVEQHIHMLDLCAWVMRDEYPIAAYGSGGRQVRTEPHYGNIYDHHSVVYEYASGVRLFAQCRQQAGCWNDISVQVFGSDGVGSLSTRSLDLMTDSRWTYRGPKNDHSQTEHDELFASIRSGQPINNGEYMSKSTLMAIMGRMASYTGKRVTWEEAMNSTEDLTPASYDWKADPPASPVAMPGRTKLA